MNPSHSPRRPNSLLLVSRRAGRAAHLGFAIVLGVVVAGCSTPKDQYLGAAEAQQRAAADDAASSKAGAAADSQATYVRLVEQMQREGLWFASLAHIDALEQRWGTSPDTQRARADALRNTGQLAQSEAFYRKLLGTPLEGAAYHGLGLVAGVRGDYAEAMDFLKRAQQRSPTDAVLLNDLGYASLRAGRFADARLPLMQAMQLQPENSQAQANLALYLEVTQQSDQASALMEARRMSPATRTAIREAARQLTSASPSAPVASPAPAVILNEAAAPLALKPSRRSSLFRAAPRDEPAPVAAALTPLPSNSIQEGTP